MTSGGGGAPLGKLGPAGMKHGPGGPWWGPGAPRDQRLAPPSPAEGVQANRCGSLWQPWRAWPRERALRTGMLLLTCHLSMKALNFFYFSYIFFFFKKKKKKKKDKQIQ